MQRSPFKPWSVTRTILIVVGAALIVMQVSATTYDSIAEWQEVRALGRQRAQSALDMLEALHTQAMRHRTGVGDDDPAVATLDNTLREFSNSADGIKLWLTMGPKLVSTQRAAGRQVETPRDATDAAAIASGREHAGEAGDWLRITRPAILGQGSASDPVCISCHTKVTGARPGDVIGAYSTAVDLSPAIAFWRSNTLHQILAGIGTTLIILGVTASLLLVTTLRPLRNLTAATRRLAEGKLDIAVGHTERKDDLGTLARSLEIFRTRLLEKKHSDEKLLHMSRHDALTGLPNRSSLNEHLNRAIETARGERKVAAISIDIKRLSDINDVYGNAVGDEVLRVLARRMTEATGEHECVARIGGDEFAAVKLFSDEAALLEFVARIENCVATTLTISGSDIRTAGDIGVAIFPEDAGDAGELLVKATLARQRAQMKGLVHPCFYEMSLDEAARHRSRLIADLWGAPARGEMSLVYQVQTAIGSDGIVGYEALLRWRHPEFGMIPPDTFIPIAEDCGAIVGIGDWVVRNACADAADWPQPYRVSVNISPKQLTKDLPERIHDILMTTGFPANRLELEITESAIIGEKAQALGILQRCKEMGLTIALDDFGTGYASIDTLRSFPFDKIKIDRSFVSEITLSPQARAIVRAIITLGHSLGVQVVAEGVETREQLALLKAEQCDDAQGYLFGRPEPHVGSRDGGRSAGHGAVA